ncbi:MAG: phage holin family protein [Prevotellaceae bacterium]|nr:phage holin family protein [Candidatus Faecinaster equi]
MYFKSEKIQNLIVALKKYLGLQRDYVMLELTEKLTLLLTALVLGAILFVVGIIIVIFISLTLAAVLTEVLGSNILAYGIIALLFIVLGIMIYIMRGKWIITPLTNFFANLLLKKNDKDDI